MKIDNPLLSVFTIFVILIVATTGCLGGSSSSTASFQNTEHQTTTRTTTTTHTPTYVEKVLYTTTILLPNPEDPHGDGVIPFTVDRDDAEITIEISPKHPVSIFILTRSEYEEAISSGTNPTILYLKENFEGGTISPNLDKGEYVIILHYDPYPTEERITAAITSGTVVVKAGDYEVIPIALYSSSLNLPEDKFLLYSWYSVSLGINIREDLDINIYLFEETEYNVWKQGGKAQALSVLKKVESGTYELPDFGALDMDKRYFLVFDNGYSLITKKTIDYTITAINIDIAEKNRVTVKITEGYYE